HLLMGMVIGDDTVPNTCNRALARALGVPVVPPARQDVGLVSVLAAAPVRANLPDGRTAGLVQLDRIHAADGSVVPATHRNVADSDVGARTWLRFLESYEIVDPYSEWR